MFNYTVYNYLKQDWEKWRKSSSKFHDNFFDVFVTWRAATEIITQYSRRDIPIEELVKLLENFNMVIEKISGQHLWNLDNPITFWTNKEGFKKYIPAPKGYLIYLPKHYQNCSLKYGLKCNY